MCLGSILGSLLGSILGLIMFSIQIWEMNKCKKIFYDKIYLFGTYLLGTINYLHIA